MLYCMRQVSMFFMHNDIFIWCRWTECGVTHFPGIHPCMQLHPHPPPPGAPFSPRCIPRWQMMAFRLSTGLPRVLAARGTRYL